MSLIRTNEYNYQMRQMNAIKKKGYKKNIDYLFKEIKEIDKKDSKEKTSFNLEKFTKAFYDR